MDIKDVKAGTYSARPTLFAWDTDKNGEVCMPMMLELCDCDYAGIHVEGRLYFDTDRVDSKGKTAADRSLETLRAIGLPGGTLESIDEHGIGNGLVSVVVDINAAGYPVAKFINPPGGGGRNRVKVFEAPAPDAKAAFFAKMRALSGAAPARANGNPPAQRPAPVTGFGAPIAGEDDIPF
jgi:hypothetical protein